MIDSKYIGKIIYWTRIVSLLGVFGSTIIVLSISVGGDTVNEEDILRRGIALMLVSFALMLFNIIFSMFIRRDPAVKDDKNSVDKENLKESNTVNREKTGISIESANAKSNIQDVLVKETLLICNQSISRIREEIQRLSIKSYFYVSLGVGITFAALLALYKMIGDVVFLEEPEVEFEWIRFVQSLIPRLSLAIFIELFAFYFLRLHKLSIFTIKYYQDELTGIEARRTALIVALYEKNENMINQCIKALLSVDRNMIIKEGDSTIELEKMKIEHNAIIKFLKITKGVLPWAKNNE